jgi:DNA replication and repair protein RecF
MGNSNLQLSSMPYLQTGIVRLMLTQFRSYPFLSLQCDARPVVLAGSNGAGKTNILEAISYFSPGRGLRSARLTEVSHIPSSQNSLQPWAVAITYTTADQGYHLGTGLQLTEGKERRVVQVDGESLKTQTRLTDYLNILWLTPQMDRLFAEGSTARRKFFDRLVYGFDPLHATRLNRYEYFMRERNNLLQQGRFDPSWLTVLEQKMAAEAIAIAAARKWVLEQLQQADAWMLGIFPSPALSLAGAAETLLESCKALDAEEAFAQLLQQMRSQDQASGRTLEGVHKTDLKVVYRDKGMLAEHCSTGEQKALLLAIIMATARLQARLRQVPPILLLDEVAAHLDEQRRQALFAEIVDLRMQAWITGTEAELFTPLEKHAQHFQVENSTINPL